MEGENIFQVNLMNTWRNMEFKRRTHVVIPTIEREWEEFAKLLLG